MILIIYFQSIISRVDVVTINIILLSLTNNRSKSIKRSKYRRDFVSTNDLSKDDSIHL